MAPIMAIVIISNPWRRNHELNLKGALMLSPFPSLSLPFTSLAFAFGECVRLEKRGMAVTGDFGHGVELKETTPL